MRRHAGLASSRFFGSSAALRLTGPGYILARAGHPPRSTSSRCRRDHRGPTQSADALGRGLVPGGSNRHHCIHPLLPGPVASRHAGADRGLESIRGQHDLSRRCTSPISVRSHRSATYLASGLCMAPVTYQQMVQPGLLPWSNISPARSPRKCGHKCAKLAMTGHISFSSSVSQSQGATELRLRLLGQGTVSASSSTLRLYINSTPATMSTMVTQPAIPARPANTEACLRRTWCPVSAQFVDVPQLPKSPARYRPEWSIGLTTLQAVELHSFLVLTCYHSAALCLALTNGRTTRGPEAQAPKSGVEVAVGSRLQQGRPRHVLLNPSNSQPWLAAQNGTPGTRVDGTLAVGISASRDACFRPLGYLETSLPDARGFFVTLLRRSRRSASAFAYVSLPA